MRFGYLLYVLIVVNQASPCVFASDIPVVSDTNPNRPLNRLEDSARNALVKLGVDFGFDRQGSVVIATCSCSRIDDSSIGHLLAFSQLSTVTLVSTTVTKAGLTHLRDIPRLKELVLGGDGFREDNLAILSELKALRRLYLREVTLTENGFRHLRQASQFTMLSLEHPKSPITEDEILGLVSIKQLKELSLRGDSISADGLVHLKHLKYLDTLTLRGPMLTDKEIAGVGGLSKLKKLYLRGTKITNAGLAYLKNMNCLEVLIVNLTNVDDDGITCLVGLPCLRHIGCLGTKITDVSLEKLAKCKQLRILDASACDNITADGVRSFKKARPDVELFHTVYLPEED